MASLPYQAWFYKLRIGFKAQIAKKGVRQVAPNSTVRKPPSSPSGPYNRPDVFTLRTLPPGDKPFDDGVAKAAGILRNAAVGHPQGMLASS